MLAQPAVTAASFPVVDLLLRTVGAMLVRVCGWVQGRSHLGLVWASQCV